jgi:hypothetical protein
LEHVAVATLINNHQGKNRLPQFLVSQHCFRLPARCWRARLDSPRRSA